MTRSHKHRSGETVRISTHTAGQNFGTFARVELLDGTTVHETPTYGLGCDDTAMRAACRWLDASDRAPSA